LDRTYGGTESERIYGIAPAAGGGYLIGEGSRSGISGTKTMANYGVLDDFW